MVVVTVLAAVFLPAMAVARSHHGTPRPQRRLPVGHAYLPPRGKLFAGVTGPLKLYVAATRTHPAVFQVFSAWGQYLPAIFADAAKAHARMMIHITTRSGPREMITPGAIARGRGDHWLMAIAQMAYDTHRITYIRLMGEMDAYWNAYCAYDANGRFRGRDHSTTMFKRAWKRVTLIMRGGPRVAINRELRRLRMPPLRTNHDLPEPRIAMMWVPQVAGAPDTFANRPGAYWPGRRWVDWVGTDFYSEYPNFSGLRHFYYAWPGLPFVFGEYAELGADDPGFISALFGWTRSHPRVRMMVYNQGLRRGGPLRLSHYPRARRQLRRELHSPRFVRG